MFVQVLVWLVTVFFGIGLSVQLHEVVTGRRSDETDTEPPAATVRLRGLMWVGIHLVMICKLVRISLLAGAPVDTVLDAGTWLGGGFLVAGLLARAWLHARGNPVDSGPQGAQDRSGGLTDEPRLPDVGPRPQEQPREAAVRPAGRAA